jgi:hypothetical protein
MSYTPFDASKPDATGQSGTLFGGSAKANDGALFDMIGALMMQGHGFSQSGGTAEEPTTLLFANGTRVLKITLTWAGGYIATLAAFLSTAGSGGPYDQIGATASFTYDGAGNLTASSNFGGFVLKMLEWVGKIKAIRTTVNSNAASIAALGSMSTQNANGVAIIDGAATLAKYRDKLQALVNGNAANALDWNAGGFFTLTATGASCSVSHSNLPNGSIGYMTGKIVNGGLASALFSGVKWPGGSAPAFSASGTDFVTLMCHDGSNVYGTFAKGFA